MSLFDDIRTDIGDDGVVASGVSVDMDSYKSCSLIDDLRTDIGDD